MSRKTINQEIYLSVLVPPAGATIKLLSSPTKVSRTLHVTKDGLQYFPPRGKKAPRMISWDILARIAKVGL